MSRKAEEGSPESSEEQEKQELEGLDSDTLTPNELAEAIREERIQLIAAERQTYHSGPLPSAETLAQYNEVIPGLGQAIVKAWQDESKHRRSIENRIVDGSQKLAVRGQWMGATLAVLVLLTSVLFVSLGHELTGFGIIIAEVAVLAAVFVMNKSADSEPIDKESSQAE